jgi:dihydroorotate dehydrogenase electron transfer subunit
MTEATAILLEQQQFGDWAWLTLGSAQRSSALVTARPGQFVAVRCTSVGSYDPLIRRPLFIAAVDAQAGTCQLLVARTDPAFAFLSSLSRGAQLDALGPLGQGWTIDGATRMLALLGAAADAAALFGLAHWAVGRGLSVSVLLGADETLGAPAPFLLPAAAEYNVAAGDQAVGAALGLLDDQVLRWADQLAVALPQGLLGAVAQRVRNVRLQWGRGFAQAALLHPDGGGLACAIGVCGVCALETRQGRRLSCVDGPIFDLRDLVR